jgi:hypothetical protein
MMRSARAPRRSMRQERYVCVRSVWHACAQAAGAEGQAWKVRRSTRITRGRRALRRVGSMSLSTFPTDLGLSGARAAIEAHARRPSRTGAGGSAGGSSPAKSMNRSKRSTMSGATIRPAAGGAGTVRPRAIGRITIRTGPSAVTQATIVGTRRQRSRRACGARCRAATRESRGGQCRADAFCQTHGATAWGAEAREALWRRASG